MKKKITIAEALALLPKTPEIDSFRIVKGVERHLTVPRDLAIEHISEWGAELETDATGKALRLVVTDGFGSRFGPRFLCFYEVG